MSRLATAITTPVTNASKQQNSTTSRRNTRILSRPLLSPPTVPTASSAAVAVDVQRSLSEFHGRGVPSGSPGHLAFTDREGSTPRSISTADFLRCADQLG